MKMLSSYVTAAFAFACIVIIGLFVICLVVFVIVGILNVYKTLRNAANGGLK